MLKFSKKRLIFLWEACWNYRLENLLIQKLDSILFLEENPFLEGSRKTPSTIPMEDERRQFNFNERREDFPQNENKWIVVLQLILITFLPSFEKNFPNCKKPSSYIYRFNNPFTVIYYTTSSHPSTCFYLYGKKVPNSFFN